MKLKTLKPKNFSFEYNGFTYEGIAVRDFQKSEEKALVPAEGYHLILLTPEGIVTTLIDTVSEDFIDEAIIPDAMLRYKIMEQVS